MPLSQIYPQDSVEKEMIYAAKLYNKKKTTTHTKTQTKTHPSALMLEKDKR